MTRAVSAFAAPGNRTGFLRRTRSRSSALFGLFCIALLWIRAVLVDEGALLRRNAVPAQPRHLFSVGQRGRPSMANDVRPRASHKRRAPIIRGVNRRFTRGGDARCTALSVW